MVATDSFVVDSSECLCLGSVYETVFDHRDTRPYDFDRHRISVGRDVEYWHLYLSDRGDRGGGKRLFTLSTTGYADAF